MARLRLDYPEPTIFTHEVPVRITDLNYGQHLGHDTLVSILHEARARLFRAHDMEEGDVDGRGVILVDLAVTYRAQVFYGQVLRIEIGAGDITSRGCDLFYRVTDRDDGALVALAKTGIVFFDYDAGHIVGMPDRFRAVIENGRGNP